MSVRNIWFCQKGAVEIRKCTKHLVGRYLNVTVGELLHKKSRTQSRTEFTCTNLFYTAANFADDGDFLKQMIIEVFLCKKYFFYCKN